MLREGGERKGSGRGKRVAGGRQRGREEEEEERQRRRKEVRKIVVDMHE